MTRKATTKKEKVVESSTKVKVKVRGYKSEWNACLEHLVCVGDIPFRHSFDWWKHEAEPYYDILELIYEVEGNEIVDSESFAESIKTVIDTHGHYKDEPEVHAFLKKYGKE